MDSHELSEGAIQGLKGATHGKEETGDLDPSTVASHSILRVLNTFPISAGTITGDDTDIPACQSYKEAQQS